MKKDNLPQTIESFTVRVMESEDLDSVMKIYQAAIDSQEANFENDSSIEVWEKIHFPNSRFVLLNENQEVVGWCALLQVSTRPCYKGVAETSIYLQNEYQGKGLGKILMKKLIVDSEEQGFWTLQTHLFPENKVAIRLHENLGFRLVGTREKLGQISGVWKDVVLLERRK
jgi:phosphinothricin acetyltransferase